MAGHRGLLEGCVREATVGPPLPKTLRGYSVVDGILHRRSAGDGAWGGESFTLVRTPR